jgi:hypothetical protein
MRESRLAADCRPCVAAGESLFNDSKRNRETDIGFQAILADQHHADSPSEPRERVHIFGDQQYYIELLIVVTQTLLMWSVILIPYCRRSRFTDPGK